MEDSKYKFLCYASGSTDIGFGHLYRLTRIIDSCNIKDQTLFLYQNHIEKSFLKSRKFHLYNNESILPELILIDSRIDCSSIYNPFIKKDNQLIIIDNIDKWVKNANSIILPSFYANEKKVNDFVKKKNINVLFGKEYSVLSSPILERKNTNDKILITFGGSDPNNVTLKVIDMLWKTEFKNRLRIIFGPGYLHNKEEIIQKYKGIETIFDCKDMALEIGNSSIVVTALGTTIQDIEFYGKKSIIICNHEYDLDDYYYINKMSRLKSRMQCVGLWKNFNQDDLIKAIKDIDVLQEAKIDKEKQWGNSWKKLLYINN